MSILSRNEFLISNDDGILAIATSLVGGAIIGNGQDDSSHYQVAANEIVKILTETSILEVLKSLPYHVLNVNIPDVKNADSIKGRKITSLGHSQIARPVHHVIDPRGRDAYWLSLRKSQKALPTESIGEYCLSPTPAIEDANESALTK
ncbi:5'/3'-nucleotidase SurE [Psychrobacter sp. PL15]|uniref:5'/3'-nucleotidase SurE n=1 Tax=Psychrobacter sp. PL15 TaxID=3071719 RepID=UPI002E0D807D